MSYRVRSLTPSDLAPQFSPFWEILGRLNREERACRVEVFTDDDGQFLGAYAIGLTQQRATLLRFETGSESARASTLWALMWRRMKEESRFLGAEILEDPNALFATPARTATLVKDSRQPYAPSYCEENSLLRLREFKAPTLVFATSPARATSFRFQRASLSPEEPVFWDYHVFVIGDDGAVYDADTTLGFPFERRSYLEMTFADAPWLPPKHQPYFRLYSKEDALHFVKSDRSHMKFADGYRVPEPPWPALHGSTTLMQCLHSDAEHGETLSLEALLEWNPKAPS